VRRKERGLRVKREKKVGRSEESGKDLYQEKGDGCATIM
jgi:hypothetical protein